MNEDGECAGIIALCMEDGTLTASGVSRPCWQQAGMAASISPAPRCIPVPVTARPALRAGLPLQDMEFVQLHPTGVYGAGVLITEGSAAKAAI